MKRQTLRQRQDIIGNCDLSSILSGKEKCHLLRIKRTGLGLGIAKFGNSGKWEKFRSGCPGKWQVVCKV